MTDDLNIPEEQMLRITDGFYRGLDVQDDAMLGSIDQGIDLYLASFDKKKADSSINYERSLSLLTLAFVKLSQAMIREDWTNLTIKRKMFLDFGFIDPRLMQNVKVIEDVAAELYDINGEGNFPKYYFHEWLDKVARGTVALTSDAAQAKAKTVDQEQIERIQKKVREIQTFLDELSRKEHELLQQLALNVRGLDLRNQLMDRANSARLLRQTATEIEIVLRETLAKSQDLDALNSKIKSDSDLTGGLEGSRAEQVRRMREELDILITVIKSCAMRGGVVKNSPVMLDRWIPMDARVVINTKGFTEEKLNELEAIDPTIFVDKNGKRIPPHVIILPGVGTGMAWTDRIMVPIFPSPTITPEVSLVRTLAAYRWYRATSAYKWQDIPGELGSSYAYVISDKSAPNLQRNFIDDYTNWMTKEALGYQVLNADVRKLFWRFIPFPKELKEKLGNRATIYRQLYQAETNKPR